MLRLIVPGRLPFGGAGTVLAGAGGAIEVTAAATVTYIADWQIAMGSGYIVIGMAGGTVRLVCRERPGDNLVVGPVAINT